VTQLVACWVHCQSNSFNEKTFAEFFCQYICHLAGLCNCLADYTVHSLSPCNGLLTALVLLNSVDGCGNTTHFLQNWCNFTCLCSWASEGFFPGGGSSGFFQKFF